MIILKTPFQYATTDQPEVPLTEEPEKAISENEAGMIPTLQATAIVIETGEIKELHADYETSKVQEVKVEVLEGEYEAKEFKIDYLFSYGIDEKNGKYPLEIGDEVKIQITKLGEGNESAEIQHIIRNQPIGLLLFLFLIVLFLVAGKQSIKTIATLFVIGFAVYFLLVKGIFTGHNVFWMTVLTVASILLCNSILTVGLNKKALTVALATFFSILIAAGLALLFSHFAKLSGTREDTILLSMEMSTVNFYFKDIILVSVMLSALGVCMNLATVIVVKLDESKKKTEDKSWKELFKTGMEVGQKSVETMINSLIFAFMGTNITILFMFLACQVRTRDILSKETMAEAAITSMTACIGILLTVPLTALFYAILNHRKTIYKTMSDNKLEGNRSLKL